VQQCRGSGYRPSTSRGTTNLDDPDQTGVGGTQVPFTSGASPSTELPMDDPLTAIGATGQPAPSAKDLTLQHLMTPTGSS
jgi:hypothetical protein